MKKYLLVVEEAFLRFLKVEAVKANKTMKDFIVEAVKEKVQRSKKVLP